MTSGVLRYWRDRVFRVLALSVLLSAVALSAVVLLSAELEERFAVHTAEALGGELVLSGSSPPRAEQQAATESLRRARVAEFSTVLVQGNETLLVSARAVDSGWPLFGSVTTAAERFGEARQQQKGPAPGETWVAEEVLDRLDLAVGDDLKLGRKALRITAVVRQEPDRGAGFYSLNPRVLFHMDDLEPAGVLGPGSRVEHRLLLADDGTGGLDAVRETLERDLRADQELETVADAELRSVGPLRQLTLWTSLAVLLVALLAGAAIHLASAQRVRRRARLAALLRSFGARRRQVLFRLLGTEFLALVPAAGVGVLAGTGLVLLLRGELGSEGALAAGPGDWTVILAGPLLLWLAFGLPRLTALVRIPAMQVLSGHGQGERRALLPELAAALAAPVLVAALLTGSLAELGELLALLVALAVLLPALFWPVLRGLDRSSARTGPALRLAVRRLSRRPALALPLLASLTVALAVLGLAGQIGDRLLDDWQQQLPERAPNHFAFNIFDKDRPFLAEWMERHDAEAHPAYPVLRGRLVEINDQPVREALTKTDDHVERTLNRDLVLGEAEELPPANRMVKGAWRPGETAREVTVEKEIAQRLELEPGDRLRFAIGDRPLEAQVTGVREVDWDSFQPNFFFLFSPGSFEEHERTWLTSFWLPPGDGARVAELLGELPHVSLMDVNALLDQARDVMAQAARATALLAALLMGAALLVLAAGLLAGEQQRARDNALLRALGARRELLRRVQWLEFALLGLIPALGATLIMLATLWPVGQRLFDGALPLSGWLLLPSLLGLGILLAGLRPGAARQPLPLTLLRISE